MLPCRWAGQRTPARLRRPARAQVAEAELVREVLCACQAVDGRVITRI